MKKRNNKGITLIALVITIIVLLILAGIAISMLAGDNGILKQAAKAKDDTDAQSTFEKIKLAAMASITNTEHKVNQEKLDEELKKYGYPKSEKMENMFKVTVGEKNYKIGENGIVTENDDIDVKIPDGFKIANDSNQDLTKGMVIEDENGNQYVWVLVPKKTKKYTWGVEYPAGIKENDYDKIEEALHAYTAEYRNNTTYTDTYYNGSGLASEEEYNELKNEMLKSIYKNQGFYVGRYEAGIQVNRTSHTNVSSSTVPISQQNKYPFTYIYCSEAQMLANNVKVEGFKSSLLFGVQWDCILVYLENCGWDLDGMKYIKTNYKTWGNYFNSEYTLNRGKYAQYGNLNTAWKDYTQNLSGIVNNQVKSYQSISSRAIVYTTGACDNNSKCNIYDLAGNVSEWTLENSNADWPCASRGGSFTYGHAPYDRQKLRATDAVDYKRIPCNFFSKKLRLI
ncbi:MAG: hypothetical protein HFJ17_02560 [Clostridia bacterium]|nr:hypothetical protein [Clostridia bacterium]